MRNISIESTETTYGELDQIESRRRLPADSSPPDTGNILNYFDLLSMTQMNLDVTDLLQIH